MKGYKMLKADMTTLYGNMEYEIGKTYKLEGEIIPCQNGYHFCKELIDCLQYYHNKDNDKRFFEIEAGNNILEHENKYVTDEITLIRELTIDEVFDYIRENKNIVNWNVISSWQKLSEDFIREFQNRVNWLCISKYQQLSEEIIKEFEHKLDWFYISMYQNLTEEFIRELQDRVEWLCISKYQRLSEGFIREFKDKVDWFYISKYQNLTEDFIREFKDEVDWEYISECQKLSEEFIREFQDRCGIRRGTMKGYK